MRNSEFWIVVNIGEKITHAICQDKVQENPRSYDVFYNYSSALDKLEREDIQAQIKTLGIEMYICPLHDPDEKI